MIFRAARFRVLRLLGAALPMLGFWAAGCESTQPTQPGSMWRGGEDDPKKRRQNEIDPTQIETRDDIFEIVQYWPQMPFLQKSNRIVGFKVTVYFRSGQTQKGAFVPGNIFVWVYELEPVPGGGRKPKLAYMWEFDQAEAMGFRVTKRAIGGYYYGFLLGWPPEVAPEGKLVEIQFGYERADKRVVLSEPRQFRVPVPMGYTSPVKETEP